MTASAASKRILILGGGFAGAYAARELEKQLRGANDVEVVLVSRENFILFTPMLHEIAGADVSVTDIVHPLRKLLKRTRVAIAEVEAIDLTAKRVRVRARDVGDAIELAYDQLVIALGAVTNFFHVPGLEQHALCMKTLGDAIVVRNRVIDALELADNLADASARAATLSVVVAGGGFAGVETAGAVNDLLREAAKFYHNLRQDMLRVMLVDPGDHLLPELGASLGHYASEQMVRRGIEVRLGTAVKGFDGSEVAFQDGTKVAARMLIWTAGIAPPPLLSTLRCKLEKGRVVATERLEVEGWPGVWALGDCAFVPDATNPGKFCPPTAQHATRQAKTLARNVVATLRGGALERFEFKTLGLLATIGRRTGVAQILGHHFSGIIAWWLWRAIYLAKLPGPQKKVRVALDWLIDLFFSKDIVQLPTLRAQTLSLPDAPPAPPASAPGSP